ncbi:putative ribonuclease H-like domain-containing protein, partial [Tanacetum coccineum]
MSSPNHPTSNIEDAFSSNFPNYIPASPDYVSALPGNTYSSSSNNSYGLVPIASPTLSLFHDDPYMKVMQAYYAKESPISPPTIMLPSLMLSPMISNLEQIIKDIQAHHQADKENLQDSINELKNRREIPYVVPVGRVNVPAGRYVVPTGKDNVIVSTGRTKVIPAGGTILVLKDEYETWAIKMEYWIMNSDHNLWNIVLNGNSRKKTGRDPKGNIMILHPVSVEEHIAVQRETKVSTILLQSLPEDHMADFHHLDDARDIWLAVKARFGGNDESKKMRKSMLKQEFSEFRVSESEGLHKGYDKFQKILSQLNQMQSKPDNEDCNIKFPRALPPSWSQVAITLKTKGGLDYLIFDDLYNKPHERQHFEGKTLEIDCEGGSKVMIKRDAARFDKKKVKCYKCSELGHFARECIGKQLDSKARYSAFKLKELDKSEEPKALLFVDSMLNWSDHEGEDEEKGAAQVYGMIAGDDDDAGDASGDVSDAAAEFALMGLSSQIVISRFKLEESKQGIDKWKESSKNLDTIINSSIVPLDQNLLGFGETFDQMMCLIRLPQAIFDTTPEDVEGKPLYDRFVKAVEMHAVPSPITGTFMPPSNKPDFDDTQIVSKTTDQKQSSTIDDPSFSFKENVKTPRNKSNIPSFVPRAAYVPAGSRNPPASVSAGSAFPAGSRNRPHWPGCYNKLYMDEGRWGTAVKTSAGCSWKIKRPYMHREYQEQWWISSIYMDNPHKNKDLGIVDSGCSRSMTGNKEKLDDFVKIIGGTVTFGGGDGKITGKGTIRTSKLNFENVYYVEELQNFNLFSVSQICDKKNKVLFTDTECLVLTKEFQLPENSQVVLRVPRRHNLYSFNLTEIQPERDITCLLAKASSDESTKWHRRMAHVNFKNINKLAKHGLVNGLPSKLFTNDHNCVACNKGKQHKASYKAITAVSTISEPLQLLHMDLFGPTSIRSIDHKYYSLVVTDDLSRFSWVFFLGTKDETYYILKDFITFIENQLNKKVKAIRCDNGTEFKNSKLIELCGSKGIKRDYSNARTPQQNGVAERKNRTLIEAARTMLADSKLPTMFWTEAVSTACYVLNRVLVTRPHNKTPYELLSGKVPNISHLKPFGCHVTILNTSDHLGKFEGKADEGFIVGYAAHSKAYRVYNLSSKKIEETLNLRYLEDKPNVQGLGQEWYFDLDYLTDSLGYTHFKSNQPAGTQDPHIHAGTQDDSDSECDEQVIVVPSFPSNHFSGPKVHEASEMVESNSDYAEELARLQRQEHKVEDTAEKYGFGFSTDTEEPLRQADVVPAGRIDLAASIPAGHIDPAASNPAGSIDPATSNSAGSIDPAASISAGSAEPFPTVLEPVHADETSLPPGHLLGSSEHSTRFPSPSDLANSISSSSEMENIYHHPSTGIFSSSSYDADFGGTVTNLAPIVAVDPVSTKKVNTIHPQSQILRDLTSPVQTRGTLKKSKFGESTFVSYVHDQQRNNHTDYLHCLFACFLSQLEPSSVAQALND